MKILVILTGGTIGSVIHDGYIYTDDNAKRLVVNNYSEKATRNFVITLYLQMWKNVL